MLSALFEKAGITKEMQQSLLEAATGKPPTSAPDSVPDVQSTETKPDGDAPPEDAQPRNLLLEAVKAGVTAFAQMFTADAAPAPAPATQTDAQQETERRIPVWREVEDGLARQQRFAPGSAQIINDAPAPGQLSPAFASADNSSILTGLQQSINRPVTARFIRGDAAHGRAT